MSLNAEAKPFVFNATVASFDPTAAAPAAAATAAVVTEVEAKEEPKPEETKPVVQDADKKKSEEVDDDEDDEEEEEEEVEVEEEEEGIIVKKKVVIKKPKATGVVKKKGPSADDFKLHDEREHMNIVFIGHVDAGKSTISGQLLLLTGNVDQRTIEKYEREAKEKNRESWYLAFIMDTNEEERAKGKTVEVGRAHFNTSAKRYTILDAPGHKNYVPNMIGGASQADIGMLVISARKGEFETGFDRGGQTREHAMLAKTLGVTKLIIVINKMDESTVLWSETRFNAIIKKLTPFLRGCGFRSSDLVFIPISGFTGANLVEPVSKEICPWYEGTSLVKYLDEMPITGRNVDGPVRLPIVTRYKDMGSTHVLGKLEAGRLFVGQKLRVMPNNKTLRVVSIEIDDAETDLARAGENVTVKVKGVEEEDVQGGFVLGTVSDPPRVAKRFGAQLVLLELLEHIPVLTTGYEAIIHIHNVTVECVITLVSQIDRKTGKRMRKKPQFARAKDIVNVIIDIEQTIAIERFDDFPQLGRFTVRDEGKTIGIGKVLKLLDVDDESKTN